MVLIDWQASCVIPHVQFQLVYSRCVALSRDNYLKDALSLSKIASSTIHCNSNNMFICTVQDFEYHNEQRFVLILVLFFSDTLHLCWLVIWKFLLFCVFFPQNSNHPCMRTIFSKFIPKKVCSKINGYIVDFYTNSLLAQIFAGMKKIHKGGKTDTLHLSVCINKIILLLFLFYLSVINTNILVLLLARVPKMMFTWRHMRNGWYFGSFNFVGSL